jgi:predicted ATPase/tRNA A-37 threonylcarbamoyl transferase component Bud32
MGSGLRTHITSLPLTVAERLDAVCDRFEAAHEGGLRPKIIDYLEGVDEPAVAVLARELIVLDLHYRHCRAEVPQVTDYDSVNPDRESTWLACAVAALTQGSTPPALPGYEILGELGRGSMGVVYKARDQKLGRLVALKVLHGPRCRDPDAVERFRREARAASALNHPHICTIYTLGEHQDQPFLVMEFIEGSTLRAWTDARPPLAQLLRWIGQVSRALQAAHAAGIVHRDIKPDNLLVRDDDVVKVLDFGVARLLADSPLAALSLTKEATAPGTLIGTARYMAPEQARCEAVGGPADLFSLGIVLYELATGRHPFEADSALGALHAVVERQPLPPSQLNPKLAGALEWLILRMLEKEPLRRPSAEEVVALLDGLSQAPRHALEASGGDGCEDGALPGNKPHPVGRRSELAELHKAFASALAGRGLLACVTGEPGLGKTTLVESFLDDLPLRGDSFYLARGSCSERLAGSEAYLPVLEALESLLRGPRGRAQAETLNRLAPNWYGQVIPRATNDSTFTPRHAEARTSTQEQMKRELIAFLEAVGRARPVVCFLDDLHWADASTVDLLVYLASRAGSMRLLLVVTYRTADLLRSHNPFCRAQLDLQGRGLCRVIALEFLSQADVDRYLAMAFPGHAFPPGFADLVHAKTEGNPLFLVDLLQYLRDRHVLAEEKGRWVLAQAVPDLGRELPQSVRSMIQRLIDQLTDDDRRLLKAASVQGQEFDAAVVAEVLALEATEVEERLEVLDRACGLVRRVGEYQLPDRTATLRYAFVHTLYQNALNEGLQPARKVAFCAAVARALLRHHGEDGGGVTAELALLFEAARDGARAADFFLRAAQKAFRVFANHEAAALARRGLDQLGALPDTPERRRCELRLQMALGVSLRTTRGFADADVEHAHARALELCGEVEPTVEYFPVLWGLCLYHVVRGEVRTGVELGEQLLGLATAVNDSALLVQAHARAGTTLLHLGEPGRARAHLETALGLYEEHQLHRQPLLFGADPAVTCRAFMAWALWLLGHPDLAQRTVDDALTRARGSSQPLTLAHAHFTRAYVHQLRREAAETRAEAEAVIALCREEGLPFYQPLATIWRGWAVATMEDGAAGLDAIHQGLAAARAAGMEILRPQILAMLAEIRGAARQLEEALAATAEGLAQARARGECGFAPELYRLRGELLMAQAGHDPARQAEAVGCFEQALAVARRQGARALELRTLESWNRLCGGDENLASALGTGT